MRRYSVSWSEVLFCAAVSAGVLVGVLSPSRVAAVVELSGAARDHPELSLSIVVAAASVVVTWAAVVWGPVRVSRARARWMLSGPGDRQRTLAGALARVWAVCLLALLVIAAAAALLAPVTLPVLLAVGAVCAGIGCPAAYAVQVAVDHRRYPSRASSRWCNTMRWRPKYLHRNTFAPEDGLASAMAVATSMMDSRVLGDACIVRWQLAHRLSAAGRTETGPVLTLVRSDLRRLLRHQVSLLHWGICVAASVLAANALVIHYGGAVPAVALIYAAGVSMAGGLRQAAGSRALRCATGRSDRYVYGCLSLIPVAAVLVAAAITLPVWGMSPPQIGIVVVGAVVAVVRGATRPPLPYDAPVLSDPVTGAPVQPLLFLALARGPVAVVVTAVAAELIG